MLLWWSHAPHCHVAGWRSSGSVSVNVEVGTRAGAEVEVEEVAGAEQGELLFDDSVFRAARRRLRSGWEGKCVGGDGDGYEVCIGDSVSFIAAGTRRPLGRFDGAWSGPDRSLWLTASDGRVLPALGLSHVGATPCGPDGTSWVMRFAEAGSRGRAGGRAGGRRARSLVLTCTLRSIRAQPCQASEVCWA